MHSRRSGGLVANEITEATHVVISDANLFLSTYPSYTRKHRQYIVHVQVGFEYL